MYLLVIDQGTTSTRVILYDISLKIIAKTQKDITQIFPNPGWVEHNPEEIFSNILILINNCLDQACNILNLSKNNLLNKILSLGIANQRETTVLWDKTSGKPVHNAIVWQDRRTASFCEQLKQDPKNEQLIYQKTGLLIDPYFSASKISWLLKQYNLQNNKNILFGTIDSYLIWRLSNGTSHYTDATNASRTALYNIHDLIWDYDLLKLFNIPIDILPTVKNSVDNFGVTNKNFFGAAIPITGVAGDQQAAAIGQNCIKPNTCKITYGTGCFVLENTGSKPIKSNYKLITTIAYLINNTPSYALEGSIFVAGAAVQWLRDAMKLIQSSSDSELIAKNLADTQGVYLVPAFTGLGAPYWDPEAKGAILGLTRETGFKHIVRAALESVCYQTRDLLTAFSQDYGLPETIRVDGGMTANNWLLQFLADITRLTIEKPLDSEATAKGAAILAGIGVQAYASICNIPNIEADTELEQKFSPIMPEETSQMLYNGWLLAVRRLLQK
ncbi:MAG: glycerol kinase GlpK [Gammaproteobacteria bacterium]|nr:glycerol kinase GlpK [Gammaproteobacteria bacterium]